MDLDTMLEKCVSLVKSAMFDCLTIRRLLSRMIDGSKHGHPESACLGYFARASSKMGAAEALYALIENNSTLGDMTSSDVFVWYRLVEHEFLESYADGTSYQQVFTHLDELWRKLPDSLFDIAE